LMIIFHAMHRKRLTCKTMGMNGLACKQSRIAS
jgi:hypothetical protein